MHRSTRFTICLGSVSLAAFVLSLTALSGQGQAPAPPPGTPPKPLVPVAASSVAKNPDPYVGEYVTLTGDRRIQPDQDLVLGRSGQDQVDRPGSAGARAEPAEAGRSERLRHRHRPVDQVRSRRKSRRTSRATRSILPADVQAKYKGKPVVLATAVINTAGIDIAKKPIPPMTADDLALQKIMTKLPPAQAALRKALDGKDLDLVKEQATLLKTAFTETEAFWKAKGNTEAMTIAAEGKKHADAILMNLGLGNLEAAKTSITPLGATCGNCHGKFRERMDDGTFRIKTAG